MNQVFTIKTAMNQHSELIIHPEKAAVLGLENRKFASLGFGNRKIYLRISLSPEIAPENLMLTSNTCKKLYLPDYPVYEIATHQNAIMFGPYIGLLFTNQDKRLTTSRLNKLLIFIKEYPKLHGALVVFALDKVDPEKSLIEGYCYNPVRKFWQRGIFPYPSAIYRTIGLSPEWKNHFLTVIGDKMFNNHYFGKWEMVQWFAQAPEINPHIPYTLLYQIPQDVFDMLEKYHKVYIKPVFGLQGRGIVQISLVNKQFILKYREKEVNHVITFDDQAKANEYIQHRFRHGRYLIQQGIDLLEYKGGLIDFRCVVQKNQAGIWVCQTIIGRAGVKESIVSNISSGGAAFTAESIIKRAIPGTNQAIADLKAKMTGFALTVCKKIDELGINCGILGLDIGLDKQGNLWLIEINNRDPDPGIALDIRDLQLYYTLKTGPLFYAKFLAGFNQDSAD